MNSVLILPTIFQVWQSVLAQSLIFSILWEEPELRIPRFEYRPSSTHSCCVTRAFFSVIAKDPDSGGRRSRLGRTMTRSASAVRHFVFLFPSFFSNFGSSAVSILRPTKVESIHIGYLGQWIMKMNWLFTIKNQFMHCVSCYMIHNYWESTQHYLGRRRRGCFIL